MWAWQGKTNPHSTYFETILRSSHTIAVGWQSKDHPRPHLHPMLEEIALHANEMRVHIGLFTSFLLAWQHRIIY